MRQATLSLVLLGAACTAPKVFPDAGAELTVTRAQVLAAGGECVLGSARDFRAAAVILERTALELAAQPSQSRLEAARAAYSAAADAWQINESLLVGPAAASISLGGGDLRDQIYSWPLVSRCALEEQLVSKGYETNLAGQLINRRGLYALEYLLYFEGADTACPASSAIVSSGSWAALSTDERAARRRAYAAAAASEVRVRADDLIKRWDPGFLSTMVNAGPGNAIFATQHQALNAMSDALFYVDYEVKDLKLARPIGLSQCVTPPCLEHLESQFAGRSKANIRSNLEGFRRLLIGCAPNNQGVGFETLLKAAGAQALATRMNDRLEGANKALDAIEEADLGPALKADPASVRALYDAVKGLSDVLKTEMMGVLDLELPQSLEGDND